VQGIKIKLITKNFSETFLLDNDIINKDGGVKGHQR